jgi:large subunit ribosomal protein L15
MNHLSNLQNSSRGRKKCKRVGRGIGSKLGKTCGRGEKGAGARSGYKRRYGYEGGQMRQFMKMPIRGFSNERFRRRLDAINLSQIEKFYQDGEIVNLETLAERRLISGVTYGVKLIGNTSLTKKVKVEVDEISKGARESLDHAKIKYTILSEAVTE